MAPVYDFRHVELDKIGRGKRIVKPPGGECSDIFSPGRGPSNHLTPRKPNNYMQSTIFSPNSAPQNGHSHSPTPPAKLLDTQNRLFGSDSEELTPRKVVNRQRSSIFEDEVDSKPHKMTPVRRSVVSPITGQLFLENGTPNGSHNGGTPNGSSNGGIHNGSSNGGTPNGSSKAGTPTSGYVRRPVINPITGEPFLENGSPNGSHNGGTPNGSSKGRNTPNGHHPFGYTNGHSSPESPMNGEVLRNRIPPGGKSSGIF